jgi:hypothetical protein
VDFDVVGIGVMPQAFLILTKGAPYLVMGTDPTNFLVQKLDIDQACTSRRSIARFAGGVMYASPDGLVFVDSSGANIVSDGYFRRNEWQALVPTSMHAVVHDGRYYCFYNSTAGFIYTPGGGFTTLNFYATACHSDPQTDALYFAISTTIRKWNTSGSKLAYTWKSKVVTLPALVNVACGKVICGSYSPNPTLKVYADTVLKHTQTVTSETPFWLPSGFRAQKWEVQVEGTVDVFAIHLADSPQELKDVV